MVHCSKMQFTKDENENGQGWCATKKSSRGEKTPQDYICKKKKLYLPAQVKSRGGVCATRLAALRIRLLRLPT